MSTTTSRSGARRKAAGASGSRRPATPAAPKRGPYAKSGETREKILAAALEVAGEVGFQRVSLTEIAARAGVAVGNLSYHFGSREELLDELMRWVYDRLLAEVLEAIQKQESTFALDEAGFRAYLAYVRRNPAYVRLAEETRLLRPDLYREGIRMWLERFRDGLRDGVARGELRSMDEAEIAAVAHFLLGTRYFIDQMMEGIDGRDYPGDDAVLDAYMRLVRGGLERR